MALKVAVTSLCRSFQLCSIKTGHTELPKLLIPFCNGFMFSLPGRPFAGVSSASKPGKQPLTPYMLFASEKFGAVQKANPGVKVTDIASMLGQMWRLLPDNEKESYRTRYAVEKASREQWKASLSEEEKQQLKENARDKKHRKLKRRQKKLQKDLDRPVPRDVNPFLLFVKAKTVERGDAPVAQYIKGLSEHWKKMPEDDKEEYIKTAKANSALHRQKMAEWKKKMIAQGHAEKLGLKRVRKGTRNQTAAKRRTSEGESAETEAKAVTSKPSRKSKVAGKDKGKPNAEPKVSDSPQTFDYKEE